MYLLVKFNEVHCFIEIPEEYRNKWESFVSSTLAEINKKNAVELVSLNQTEFYFTHTSVMSFLNFNFYQSIFHYYLKWMIIWFLSGSRSSVTVK